MHVYSLIFWFGSCVYCWLLSLIFFIGSYVYCWLLCLLLIVLFYFILFLLLFFSFFFFFFFFFYNCIVLLGFLSWEIWIAFRGESQLRQSRVTQHTVHAGCFSVSIIRRTLTWTTGSLACAQMLMHAIAQGGVRTHARESALKIVSRRKSLAAPGNRTCLSGVPVRRSTNWATSPPPFILSRVAPDFNFWFGDLWWLVLCPGMTLCADMTLCPDMTLCAWVRV